MSEFERAVAHIRGFCESISASRNLPDGFLSLIENQDNSVSLWMNEPLSGRKTKMILRTEEKGRRNKRYISMMVKSSMIAKYGAPIDVESIEDKHDAAISYLTGSDYTSEFAEQIETIIQDYIENYEPSEKFGCCHRYRECSNAKKCLHPNQFYARSCQYRKNLESGKIFY